MCDPLNEAKFYLRVAEESGMQIRYAIDMPGR